MIRYFSVLAFLGPLALPLSAQTLSGGLAALPPGARVRVSATTVPERWLKGTFIFARPDSLFLDDEQGRRRALSRLELQRVDVSRGKDLGRGALRGAWVGAIAGGVLFGIVALAANVEGGGGGDPLYLSHTEALGLGFAFGVGVGVPIGIVIGVVDGLERWERVH